MTDNPLYRSNEFVYSFIKTLTIWEYWEGKYLPPVRMIVTTKLLYKLDRIILIGAVLESLLSYVVVHEIVWAITHNLINYIHKRDVGNFHKTRSAENQLI